MDKEHLNIHDPHNQYTWADDRLPWWVTPLKIVKGIAKGAGVVCVILGVIIFIYVFTGVMLELEGVRQ